MGADNKKKKNTLNIDGKRLSTDRIAKAAFLQVLYGSDFNFVEFIDEIVAKHWAMRREQYEKNCEDETNE